MLTFQELADVDLTVIDSTAEGWERLAKAMTGDQERCLRDVIAPLDFGAWTGKDADTALKMLRVFAAQLEAARIEAAANAAILREAQTVLAECKLGMITALRDVQANGLTLKPDGSLSWSAPDDLADRQKSETAHQISARMTALLQKAVDADVLAATTLLANVNWNDAKGAPKNDFNAGSLGADPAADAQRTATLLAKLSKDGTLTASEADIVRTTLTQNAGNAEFSTTMLKQVGPEGLVKANLSLSQFQPVQSKNDPRLEDFKQIQTLLGGHLATASPVLAKDNAWMAGYRAAGEQKFQISAKDGSAMTDVYGYQVFGTLLGQGTYDKDFLLTTAEDIRQFENKNGGSSVWGKTAAPQPQFPLNLNLNGADPKSALDPMAGVLTGFKNNPDASTAYFDDKPDRLPDGREVTATGEAKIKYLLENNSGSPSVDAARQDTLGQALVSATTGPPGSPELAEQRVGILETTINTFAEKGTPEPLKDSVVDMLSGNAESLNAALTQARSEDKGPTMPIDHGPLAEISRGDMTKVLSEVASDPGNIETLKKVQEGYTYATLDQVNARADISPQDKATSLKDVMYSSSEAFGIMDSVVAQDIRATDENTKADGEKGNAQIAMWTGLAIDTTTTVVSASAVAANPVVGVPVTLGATYVNAWVGDFLGASNNSSDADARVSEVYTNGAAYSEGVMTTWAEQHPESGVSAHTANNQAHSGFASGDQSARNESG
ncbi:hypothetical protein [Streptodolium elevatio]|uniref:Uncharacterized protein n=1 Tax=Streptodolium elevatio TaxID=3157996 RepID=A0ABV3DJ13_9ACTN